MPALALALAPALFLAACGVPDAIQQIPPEAAAEAAAETTAEAAAEAAAETTAEHPAALSAPPASTISATVEALAPRTVPDGLGGTVDATAPVTLSLGGGWGGRALDPVLVVGQRRFTEYDYPAPGVLRYTLPDRGLLQGDEARVQWTEDDGVDVSTAVQEALR